MISTFDFQIKCQDERQYADFHTQPPGSVLIKQTKSELMATNGFLHKRSSGLK